MSEFLYAASEAALKAIEQLASGDKELYTRHNVGAGGDYSLGADLITESIFIEYLLPFGSIDSEESGVIAGEGEDKIVLDPLDGSDNFLSHIPYYGASIALCDKNGATKEAVIFNFCTKSAIVRFAKIPLELESRADNENAIFSFEINDFLHNGLSALKPIKITPLGKCGIFEKAYSNPLIALKLYENKIKFRSLGASALSIALSFEVNFMLFMGDIRHFDSKAGLFLCEGLHKIHTKNFLLISKDKRFFDIIHTILQTHTQKGQ